MKYKRVIIADAIAFYNVETSAVNIITMADYQSDNFDRIVSISKAAELAGFGRIHFANSRQFMLAHPDTGLDIYDTIRKINCDVSTICVGDASSMGAFLLAAGTKGKRYALANSQVMIHQVLGGMQGQASDIEIEAAHIIKVKERLNRILAENTGHSVEEIETDTDRNNWMFGEEARAYGIVDHVL